MLNSIELSSEAIIKVVGVGGGGGNAVEHMMHDKMDGIDYFVVNTDVQALRRVVSSQIIQIGNNITKGLGAGANPEIGRNSAKEDYEILRAMLDGADMLFISVGMGGGTGTGASPVIAEIARELGILTVAVVTKPFSFEGKKRMIFAEYGISELSKYVDSLIIISNDKLLKVLGKETSLLDAFSIANDILKCAVQGISELIIKPGLINVDFADVRTVMSGMGYAMMGFGKSCGENRAEIASKMAISSPLLEDIDLSGAKGILVNITSGVDFRLDEFEIIGNIIRGISSEITTVVIGTSLDSDINNDLRVTILVTGIGDPSFSSTVGLEVSNGVKNTNNFNDFNNIFKFKKNNNFDYSNHYSCVDKQKILNDKEDLNIPTFFRKRVN